MTFKKEKVIKAILQYGIDNKEFSIVDIKLKAGVTTEVARKWTMFFVKKGLVIVSARRTFRGRFTDKINSLDASLFFELYSGAAN
jgi:predicted transcriptional regulator